MIEVFPSKKSSPQQVLIQASKVVETMDHIAIIYMEKGQIHPRLTCSSMLPVDMNFLGSALVNYSHKFLKD